MKFLAVLFSGAVLTVIFGFVGINNMLVSLDTAPLNRWYNMESNYQNRYAICRKLIPAAEKADLKNPAITALITAFTEAASIEATNDTLHDDAALREYEAAQERLWKALKDYFRSLESIEDPKQKALIKDFGLQLDETADAVAGERWHYNKAVKRYNETIKKPVLKPIVEYSKFKKRARSEGPVKEPAS